MRIRFFFWLILVLTCVSVLTFAIFFRRDVPALIHLSLDHPVPKVHQVVTLNLHLTDSGGVPINNAAVTSSINMTNMDMGVSKHQLEPVGQGKYTTHLRFSMSGSWFVTVSIHARGIVPTQQHLLLNAT